MSQTIQVKRGLIASLPANAAAGEPVFTTDDQELHFGTGASIVPLKIKASNIVGLVAEQTTNKDAINGYAGLDASAKLKAAEFPAPSATTFGGVKSLAAVATKYLTSIGTDGIPVAATPAFTDISGQLTAAQLPTVIDGGIF